MFSSPYETTACVGNKLDQTIGSIRELVAIRRDISPIMGSQNKDILPVYALLPTAANIAPFSHPITVGVPTNNKSEGFVVIDARPYVGMSKDDIVIRNLMELNVSIGRGLLQSLWVSEGVQPFLSVSEFPGNIFSNWISETLARSLGLDLGAQLAVRVIAAHHFLCLFDAEPMDMTDTLHFNRTVLKLGRITGMDGHFIQSLLTNLNPSGNLKDFCNNLALHSGSVRLTDMVPEVLISILSRSWFGVNAASVVGVSLEYPPTWYAMLNAALKQQGLKRTNIAQLALMRAKDNTAKSFGLFTTQHGTGGLNDGKYSR